MIDIKDKSQCAGCSACYSACPQMCIEMRPDEEGYLYPVVDIERCIDCGLCERVCPVCKPIATHDRQTIAFVAQNKDEQIRKNSASGGAFSAIATAVISKGGVVFGGCFDKQFNVRHDYVTEVEDLAKLRCSKYVQSDVGESFSKVKRFLQEGRLVLFSGTPCQVNGLLSFLKRKYHNLITLDLVCRGTPSPGLWKKYLNWLSSKEHSAISSVSFRDKHYGYAGSTMAIGFENGKTKYTSRAVQFFKYAFFQDINNRPSCFECHFKTIKRESDITLFDCWHVNELDKTLDDDRGTTMVLIHSEQGETVFNEAKPLMRFSEVDVKKAILLDGVMATECPKPNPNREQFFADAQTLPFNSLVDKYYPCSFKKSLVQMLKPIMHRTGILHKLKRLQSR